MTTKIAIFASGSGSNFQAIQTAIENGKLDAEIGVVVTDKPDAYVVKRAENFGIPVFSFVAKQYESKADYEQEIINILKEHEVQWVILAGYMRLIGNTLLSAYSNRIVNIHPSLLPAFPGKDAIGQALEHGVKVTGVTVHFVDEGLDTGPILSQAAVDVVEGNRSATEAKIHALEHELYTSTLQKLFKKEIKLFH
ncbi:phosphoribosylglycinamide formyltransferase [Ureibacillus chungkukjangi]|uniref:Phosphoribosylglycinamide formyltransferase n=1 Tax=Ureibacillus chungkukjangi TaxID=1202712 RepID=A0A318TZU4_9BACL|nr:phosphoribosylglycinamide formyltransferase [Ureibacillus chungkukjangi]MCM3389402.1 phosphoribosylglycinamide formyltransferase [Ureibacillus chungkukjangi]PYF05169.1 formyltetrahydrofolate-dependent phosphoribosylglycinamide formyltransferase [Ureibacillus chungkukjangi]HCG4535953.1 phosphoribosylglycinamide formyltransferase [Salmonella enterica subsp. enterica serovar Typhi str. AG3]